MKKSIVPKINSLVRGLCLWTIGSLTIAPINVRAQITPDGTVNSQTIIEGNNVNITGGTRQGNNLFHSFEQFSLTTGEIANFLNDADIQNIFTRITGDAASNIDGILRAQGSANLFLINPNGIIFGENAALDLGGSFVGTSANRIEFADGNSFRADDTNTQPILTVSVPVGLGFGVNESGPIVVNGNGHQITSESPTSQIKFDQRPKGLFAPLNETLALVGNGVNLNGGVVSSVGNGQVYLTSVNSGLIGINQTESGLVLLDENVTSYQDINLNQQSLIDASSEQVGTIFLVGKNINITGQSFVLSQNQGDRPGSSINIKASNLLTVSGRSSTSDVRSNIRSETLNTGEGADINISANSVLFQDGARIRTNSFSDALGGDIRINATDSIELYEPSSIIASTFAQGNAGNIDLSTSELKLDGAAISSSTFGNGNGGLININADLIEIARSTSTTRAAIASSSFGNGNAGSVLLNTAKLRVLDGSSLSASSYGGGNAGDITVNASESIEVNGISNFRFSDNPQSTIRSAVQVARPESQRRYQLPAVPTGSAGNLTLNTPSLNVSQQGSLNVENEGTGDAGILSINADSIYLDNAGSINAASSSGTGGNINLSTNQIFLDNDSQITATAGNNGNGGNININTTSLITKKNSDISANAFEGNGGNINIAAEGLFTSPDSSITASSQLGIDGTVRINTPDNEIERELSQSSPEVLSTEAVIAQSCVTQQNARRGSFVDAGNGGLPSSPSTAVSEFPTEENNTSSQTVPQNNPSNSEEGDSRQTTSGDRAWLSSVPSWKPGSPIIRGNKVIITQDGQRRLVADADAETVEGAEYLVCKEKSDR